MKSEVAFDSELSDFTAMPGGPVRQFARRFPLASNKLLAIGDQAIVSATSFATAVIIGRATSPDELGAYYLTLSLVFVIVGLQYQSIAAPYSVYSRRRSGNELDEYAGSMWVHQFVLTGVVAAVLLVTVPMAWWLGRHDLFSAASALLIALPLLLLREAIRRFSFANLKLVTPIAIDVAVAVIQLSSLAALGYFGLLSLWSIYAAMAVACALAAAGWYLLDRPRLRFKRQRFLADWRHNWKFSRWTLPTFLLTNLSDYALLWVVGLMVGVAVTGMFGACVTLVGLSNVFIIGVNNVLTAQAAQAFANGGRQELVRALLGAAALMAIGLGSLCLLVMLTGDWLPIFVYGDQYVDCGTVVMLLALARLTSSFGVVAANGLWAIEQPRLNFLADVCSVVATAVAVAFLVFPFGAQGAAAALLIGSSIDAAVRLLTLAHALRWVKSLPTVTTRALTAPLISEPSVT